jgi:hypothetical protein
MHALASLIQTRSQYTEYISHLLQTLCGILVGGSSLSALVIQNELIPFWPIDIQLPQDGSGYCYIIVLLQDMGTTYIGQALSLVNQLNQHNQGSGSLQTLEPRLCPWSLILFVCGFDGNRDMMRRFELIGRGGDSTCCRQVPSQWQSRSLTSHRWLLLLGEQFRLCESWDVFIGLKMV